MAGDRQQKPDPGLAEDPAFRRAEEWIARARPSAIEMLDELVAVPTVNPPGNQYHECALLLAERLREQGIEPRLADVPSHELERMGLPPDRPRPTLLASLGPDGSDAPTLHFHGHYDVVPADSNRLFRLRVKGDEAWGRGTAYMKGGLVALLLALGALRPLAARLRGRILLSIVPDEITGGTAGIAHLFRGGALPTGSLGMLTPEPTGGQVWHGNRGALSQLLTVGGKTAHVTLQHRGCNAFEGLLDLGGMLRELKAEIEARRFNDAPADECGPPSALLLGGLHRGGTNFSMVPETASFSIDRRFDPRESPDAVAAELEAVYMRFRAAGGKLTVRELQQGAASLTPSDAPLARLMEEVVTRTCGAPAVFRLCPGILEARFFVTHGTPALAYGPGALEHSHTTEERVRLSRILSVARVYARMAWMLLGTP